MRQCSDLSVQNFRNLVVSMTMNERWSARHSIFWPNPPLGPAQVHVVLYAQRGLAAHSRLKPDSGRVVEAKHRRVRVDVASPRERPEDIKSNLREKCVTPRQPGRGVVGVRSYRRG